MLLFIVTFLVSSIVSLPNNYNSYDDVYQGYFNAVAEDTETHDPTRDLTPGNLRNTDLFPEDPVDPNLLSEFFYWSKAQPPITPLSTWKPPEGIDNITDNSFGAISRGCPPGCYRSRAGNCLPVFTWDESETTKTRKGACDRATGGLQRGHGNTVVLSSMRILFLSLTLSLVTV